MLLMLGHQSRTLILDDADAELPREEAAPWRHHLTQCQVDLWLLGLGVGVRVRVRVRGWGGQRGRGLTLMFLRS